MSPELESRIYASILRAVMWGADREEIFEMLQVNGITGEPAEQIFRRAWGERVAFIRGESIRKATKGALLLIGGSALVCVFWFGFGFITSRILVISALLIGWGLWWSVDGTMDAFMASKKRGSVTPD